MTPDGAVKQRGWWRRAGWGLLALPLIIAGLLGAYANDAYERYWTSQPREPLAAATDGWVGYGGGHLRLAELSQLPR